MLHDIAVLAVVQVEILGRSLFWDSACKSYDLGLQNGTTAQSDFQLSDLLAKSLDQQSTGSLQSIPASTSQGFDLLSDHWAGPGDQETIPATNPFLNDDLVQTATNPFLSWEPFAPTPTNDTLTTKLESSWHQEDPSSQPKANPMTAVAEYIEILNNASKANSVWDLNSPLPGQYLCTFYYSLMI